MRAALFDMDRTLVRKETASLYVRHQLELGEARRRDLLRVTWWVAQYTLGIIDVPVVAAKAARSFAGTFEPAFATRCDDWFREWVEPHVADAGRETVERHRACGELCAIVTGASRHAAWPLARRLGIAHVIASELEVDGAGRFTGRYVEPLCIGRGKVERTERFAAEAGFSLAESSASPSRSASIRTRASAGWRRGAAGASSPGDAYSRRPCTPPSSRFPCSTTSSAAPSPRTSAPGI